MQNIRLPKLSKFTAQSNIALSTIETQKLSYFTKAVSRNVKNLYRWIYAVNYFLILVAFTIICQVIFKNNLKVFVIFANLCS